MFKSKTLFGFVLLLREREGGERIIMEGHEIKLIIVIDTCCKFIQNKIIKNYCKKEATKGKKDCKRKCSKDKNDTKNRVGKITRFDDGINVKICIVLIGNEIIYDNIVYLE